MSSLPVCLTWRKYVGTEKFRTPHRNNQMKHSEHTHTPSVWERTIRVRKQCASTRNWKFVCKIICCKNVHFLWHSDGGIDCIWWKSYAVQCEWCSQSSRNKINQTHTHTHTDPHLHTLPAHSNALHIWECATISHIATNKIKKIKRALTFLLYSLLILCVQSLQSLSYRKVHYDCTLERRHCTEHDTRWNDSFRSDSCTLLIAFPLPPPSPLGFTFLYIFIHILHVCNHFDFYFKNNSATLYANCIDLFYKL